MKRIIYVILSLSLFICVSHAQKPVKGNVLTELSMAVSGFSDNIYLLNGNFDSAPTIRGRYFLTDDIVLRGDLNFINKKSTKTHLNPLDDSKSGTAIDKNSGFGLGVGIEKHLAGISRLSPFLGGGLSFGLTNSSTEYTDASANMYVSGNKEESSQKGSIFGAEGFVGADYWINNSFYVGAQFGLGLLNKKTKDGERIENGTKSKLLGSTENTFATVATPFIRLGWNFNGDNSQKNARDSDKDGVPDDIDKCPNTPKGEKVTLEGCPVFADEIRLLAKNIYFETASDKIKSSSFESLNKVAEIMVVHPNANLSIEGHTDSHGDDAMNLDLSKRRAQSVLNYLSGKGVDVGHLMAKGFGEMMPIADNSTEEGRALNRRVELIVTY